MAVLFRLTLRQVLGRKSTIVLLLASLAPVLLALVFVFSDPEVNPERWTANRLLGGLVVRALLPLVALFLGTSVFGNEVDDGTAVYLLTKPVPRSHIIAAKLGVAAVATIALIVPPTVAATLIALEGSDHAEIAAGFGVAVAAGAVLYSTVFLLASILTSRALVAGIFYVFIWEAVVSGIFTGTRIFSVRHLTLGIADAIVSAPASIFDSEMGAVTSIVALVSATLVLGLVAVRRLEAFEIKDTA